MTDVGFATAIQGIGSAVLLNVLLWLAIVISIPFNGFEPAYVTVAIVSVLLLGFFAALVAGFASGEGWAVRVLRRLANRFRFIPKDKLERTVGRIAERLQALRRTPSSCAGRGVGGGQLAPRCRLPLRLPLGARIAINPVDVFVAYGVGNVLSAIPLTPGGLGSPRLRHLRAGKLRCRGGRPCSRSSGGVSSTSGCRSRSARSAT